MSELNVFLVPIEAPEQPLGVKDEVVDYLERRGIIEGLYDDALGWYAAGPKSMDLFVGIEDVAFEYAIVHDRAEARFVPDSHTGGFDSTCAECDATIDDDLVEMLCDVYDGEEESDELRDMSEVAVTCTACGQPNPLKSLEAGIETAVTRFFLNFCVVDTFEFNPKIIGDLERLVGRRLGVIPERL